MIFRPATDEDIEWVRNHIKPSVLSDIEDMGLNIDEAWNASSLHPETEHIAFFNDQGISVAIIRMSKVPEDKRQGAVEVGLSATPEIKKQPIGFLKALRDWQTWVFKTTDYDEMVSFVSDTNQTSLKMMTKFLRFKLETTLSQKEPHLPPFHFLTFSRADLNNRT